MAPDRDAASRTASILDIPPALPVVVRTPPSRKRHSGKRRGELAGMWGQDHRGFRPGPDRVEEHVGQVCGKLVSASASSTTLRAPPIAARYHGPCRSPRRRGPDRGTRAFEPRIGQQIGKVRRPRQQRRSMMAVSWAAFSCIGVRRNRPGSPDRRPSSAPARAARRAAPVRAAGARDDKCVAVVVLVPALLGEVRRAVARGPRTGQPSAHGRFQPRARRERLPPSPPGRAGSAHFAGETPRHFSKPRSTTAIRPQQAGPSSEEIGRPWAFRMSPSARKAAPWQRTAPPLPPASMLPVSRSSPRGRIHGDQP